MLHEPVPLNGVSSAQDASLLRQHDQKRARVVVVVLSDQPIVGRGHVSLLSTRHTCLSSLAVCMHGVSVFFGVDVWDLRLVVLARSREILNQQDRRVEMRLASAQHFNLISVVQGSH